MESSTMSLLFGLAAVFAPYIITQPHHIRVFLAVLCFALFSQSVTNYHDAMDLDMPTSTIIVFGLVAFFSGVANKPLSWLSLILYADPSEVPISERPPPISQWFGRPRELIPPDSNSQGRRRERSLSEVAKSIFYQQMFERADAENVELRAKVEQVEEQKAYVASERDEYQKRSDRQGDLVDVYATMVLNQKAERDERIHSGKCPGCKHEVDRLAREAAHADEKIAGLEDSIETTKAETDKALAEKDKVIEEKEKIIEDKDKVIEEKDKVIAHKDRQAELYGQKRLLQALGNMDTKYRSKAREFDSMRTEKDGEIARLNGIINSRKYCCCGRCGPALPSGPRNDGGDDGDDDDDTNGGSPPGGNAQPPTPAKEPSGAPPAPVDDSSNPPPPTVGAPSDHDAAPVPSPPATPTSSPLSSVPASPISSPALSAPGSPASVPMPSVPDPSPPVSDPSTPVPDPTPPASGTSGPHPPTHGA
jgi:hypothetical protein